MSGLVLNTITSAVAILSGTLVGAYCSWVMNKKMHKQDIAEKERLVEDNRKYEEIYRAKEICINANVMRLDIATALFQSLRSLRNTEEKKFYLFILPINKNYSQSVAALSDYYTLKELSYIYQLYGIIEKVNRDINSWNYGDLEAYKRVKVGFETILYKIYGDNFRKILFINPEKISYKELYKNDYIINEYRLLLEKLDHLCDIENLLKEGVRYDKLRKS